MQSIKHALEFYRDALSRFGFNHAIPRNIAQAIRVMYGHEGAQALARVNAEAGMAQVPTAPSVQNETVILASGTVALQNEASTQVESKNEIAGDAKKKRKEQRRSQTETSKRKRSSKIAKGVVVAEKDKNENDWPWPGE